MGLGGHGRGRVKGVEEGEEEAGGAGRSPLTPSTTLGVKWPESPLTGGGEESSMGVARVAEGHSGGLCPWGRDKLFGPAGRDQSREKLFDPFSKFRVKELKLFDKLRSPL